MVEAERLVKVVGMWVLVVGVVGVGGGKALSKREGARVWTGERTPTEGRNPTKGELLS